MGSSIKGKGSASASDSSWYETLDRIHFGKYNLICYPKCNLSSKEMLDCKIDRPQRCLMDNLWMAYNKKDIKYFIATLNALGHHFTEKNTEKKFKFYVVIHGKTNGVFQTW